MSPRFAGALRRPYSSPRKKEGRAECWGCADWCRGSDKGGRRTNCEVIAARSAGGPHRYALVVTTWRRQRSAGEEKWRTDALARRCPTSRSLAHAMERQAPHSQARVLASAPPGLSQPLRAGRALCPDTRACMQRPPMRHARPPPPLSPAARQRQLGRTGAAAGRLQRLPRPNPALLQEFGIPARAAKRAAPSASSQQQDSTSQ